MKTSTQGSSFRASRPLSRRQALRRFGTGFGLLGLAGILANESFAQETSTNPLALKPSPYPAKAKRVIFLFMSGGPSHVDLFDPKPRLKTDAGKPLPFDKPKLERTPVGVLMGSPFSFKKYGQCGTELSEL